MEFIRGEDREQIILLPESVEEYVEENGTVRIIDAYVNNLDLEDLGFTRWETKATGRPAYDPKDMLKLYIYGYMNRVRSSRRLETESKRNMEVIWLLRKLFPDHKTIANFRKDNPKALRNVFRHFVKLCVELDLYGKELIAIDGSKFKAVNSKDRNFTKGKLEDRIKMIDKKLDEYLKELDENDNKEEKTGKEKSTADIKKIIKELNERKITYQGYADELEKTGETQKSLTDPESRLMLANGKMDVCYNVQTAVDAKNKLIAEFEVTNNPNDKNLLTPMAVHVKETLCVDKIIVTADEGYASASDVAAAIQIGVEPHVAGVEFDICIPVKNGEQTEPASLITSHNNGKSVYLKDRNIAICPMGKVLYPAFYKKARGEAIFHNSQACKTCTCRCTIEQRGLRFHIIMDESEFSTDYNDKDIIVKQINVKADQEIYKQRKSLSEHPFGTVKRAMDSSYCLLKGKRKLTGEFALIFMAYNFKRVINILGINKLMKVMVNIQ
jgi:transposase